MPKYYVLAERVSSSSPWGVSFGAIYRADVDAEREDRRDHGVRASDLKVLTIADAKQSSVDAAIAALNGVVPPVLVPTPIIDRLARIAGFFATDGYLKAYSDDLFVHDRRSLERSKAGDRFVWALREAGTQLFPIAAGMDSIWLTFWLDQGNMRAVPTKCYVVRVLADGGADGKVTAISDDTARKLASLPHPEGKVIKLSLFGTGG
jgi:hypothetical protein